MMKIQKFSWMFLILFSAFPGWAQIETPNVRKSVHLEKMVRVSGWVLPDLSRATVIDTDKVEEKGVLIERRLFKVSDLEIVYNYEIQILRQTDNSSSIEHYPCELRTAVSYAFGGNLYAYSFSCTPAREDGGDYVGLLMRFYLFDEDGDGKFETKYLTGKMPEHVPEWAGKTP